MYVPDSRFHAERVLSTQKLPFSRKHMYIHVHTCTYVYIHVHMLLCVILKNVFILDTRA